MKLYTYFRSSAAYREESPLGIVPVLQVETGVLTQSLAIIEWLDETYPLLRPMRI